MIEVEPDVVEMLIRHELTIKELSEIFATTFKNHEHFWQNLAADEKRHADLLVALRSESIRGKWLLDDRPLKFQAINTSIRYVERSNGQLLLPLGVGQTESIAFAAPRA